MALEDKARRLMQEQTKKNKSPAWSLTEIAVKKGRDLSKIYKVDEELVVVSLYLAHIVFSRKIRGKVQQNHPKLSSSLAKRYLDKWKVPDEKKKIILNAIEAHHGKVDCKTKIAEVVKNAECNKFVTVEGALVLLHEMGIRGMEFNKACEYGIAKMEQKLKLLTLADCKKEAKKNCKEIKGLLKYIPAKV